MHALIIGGTHGLGFELAERALDHGLQPIVTGRQPQEKFLHARKPVRYETMTVENEESVADTMTRLRNDPSLDIRALFYLPGTHLRGAFCTHTPEAVAHLFEVCLFGFMRVIRHFHPSQHVPYHLVCVGSTSTYRIRQDEAVYGSAKAAQAQFARNFHQELVKDLPGSHTILSHPCGMKTPFWNGTNMNTEGFLHPSVAAEDIWNIIRKLGIPSSTSPSTLTEVHTLRWSHGKPTLAFGAKAPE